MVYNFNDVKFLRLGTCANAEHIDRTREWCDSSRLLCLLYCFIVLRRRLSTNVCGSTTHHLPPSLFRSCGLVRLIFAAVRRTFSFSLNPLTAVPLVLSDSRVPHTPGFNTFRSSSNFSASTSDWLIDWYIRGFQSWKVLAHYSPSLNDFFYFFTTIRKFIGPTLYIA